jgi:hypothetical protein
MKNASRMAPIVLVGVLLLLIVGVFAYQATRQHESVAPDAPSTQSAITESDARLIAEKSCIKGGQALTRGTYDITADMWLFEANLNMTREGCTSLCAVDPTTKSAKVLWRCAPGRD